MFLGCDRRLSDKPFSLGHLCERLPTGLRDPHAHNVSLWAVGDHALALRGCESGLDQFDHYVDREPVRTQDRLGVTVTAAGKQFEGAAAVRIGTAMVASGRHRCTVTIIAPTRRGSLAGGSRLAIGAGRKGRHDLTDQRRTCRLVRYPPDTPRVKKAPVVRPGLSKEMSMKKLSRDQGALDAPILSQSRH
jgi:hypothetical protein